MTTPHACYDTDARSCWDLRYYGYSPVLRGERAACAEGEEVYFAQSADDDGECECSCHEDDDDDLSFPRAHAARGGGEHQHG